MEVSILGTGCHKCLSLEMMVARLLEELNLSSIQLKRVDDPHQIRKFIPEDAIPGLVINGQMVSSGYLPDQAKVRLWLNEAAQVAQRL